MVIRKSALFYEVYEDDAEILSFLLGYKYVKGRVGFPTNAINKVVNVLEDKKINYRIIDEEEKVKDFKNLNQYLKVLAKAKDKITVENKINNILKILRSLDEGKLCEILGRIENIVYEYN